MKNRETETTEAKNILLFVPTIVNSIIIPLIYMMGPIYSDQIYTILQWSSAIAEGMTIGILIYLVVSKDLKLNLTYLCPYTLGYIIFNFVQFTYCYDVFFLYIEIFRQIILWGILYFVCKMINKDSFKPIFLIIVAFLVNQYVIDWIAYRYFLFDIYAVLQLAVIIGTTYFVFKKYSNTNIFEFTAINKNSGENQNDKQGIENPDIYNKTGDEEKSDKIMKCPGCQQIYYGNRKFCSSCGMKLNDICPNCGNIINEGVAFCNQCGTRIFSESGKSS